MTTIMTHTPAREELLRLARYAQRFYWADTATEVAALSPLPDHARDDAFRELGTAVTVLDGVEGGTVHWSEVVPDAEGSDRDGQALDAARTAVDLALDVLVGGAR